MDDKNTHPDQDTPSQPLVNTPVNDTSYKSPTPNSAPIQPPVSEGDRQKVQLIGNILLVASLVSLLSAIYLAITGDGDGIIIDLVIGVLLIMIGLGLKKYNKVAYTAFNFLALLAILSAIFVVPAQLISASIALRLLELSPLGAFIMFLSACIILFQFALFIVGGVLFHKKSIRLLFK